MYYRHVPAQSKFHKRLLDCIGCCAEELPQLVKDGKQLGARQGLLRLGVREKVGPHAKQY